jgi:4-hydroxy-4-methyl-2-oxoglutarate aldolase
VSSISMQEVCERYRRLYVGLVADVLDKKGLRQQALSHELRPLTRETKVAGPAFTILGRTLREGEEYKAGQFTAVDALVPNTVVVLDAGGDATCAHWGELICRRAMNKGAIGAVIDGCCRDLNLLIELGFPVFIKRTSLWTSVEKWEGVDYQCEIRPGGVLVKPGDFIFGDYDGLVAVPRDLTLEVLLDAEEAKKTEELIRGELENGASFLDMYRKYRQL